MEAPPGSDPSAQAAGTPVPVSVASSPQAEQRQGLILQILAAVATGIGVLGFVTFFGGALLWVRARESGLAAEEAVAVVPKSVLITTGASFLVPAVLLALLAVGGIFGIHQLIYLPRRIRAQGLAKEVADLRHKAHQAELAARPHEEFAASARAMANDAREGLTAGDALASKLVGQSQAPDVSGTIEQLQEEAATREAVAQEGEEAARRASLKAARIKSRADKAAARLESKLETPPALHRAQRAAEYAATTVVLVVLPLWGSNWAIAKVGFFPGLALAGIVAAAAFVSLTTYLATEKFVWFGVMAFASVGIYFGAATYFRSIDEPKVEPAAVLRTEGRSPVFGVFVAQTPDKVYVGTFDEGHGNKRLLVIPSSQVTDLAVGPVLDMRHARDRAIALAADLCDQKIEQETRKQKRLQRAGKAPGRACTPRQADELRKSLRSGAGI